jgi:hypothetical protein
MLSGIRIVDVMRAGIAVRQRSPGRLPRTSQLTVIAVLCVLSTWAIRALCSEGGASNFPNGAQTIGVGILPPKGATALFGYFVSYAAPDILDADGRQIATKFHARVLTGALRIAHTWGQLGRFSAGVAGVIQPLAIELESTTRTGSDSGIALVGLEPLNLTTRWGNVHLMSGTLFYLPADNYRRNRFANASLNYATVTHQLGITYLDSRFELSANPHVSYNFENDETDYQSGVQYGVTWGAMYRPPAGSSRWQIGLNGYYVTQANDDRLGGSSLPRSRTERVAIGPQIAFWPTTTAAIAVKWQKELHVENGARGDLLWLQFVVPFRGP